jgi:purine-binding chemotaxis protein CheW
LEDFLNTHSNQSVEPSTETGSGGRFTTFYVDGMLFGVEVMKVQEVLRAQASTRVPLAPEVVSGLINLRGQIVTSIDMRRRLNLPLRAPETIPMNIVVRSGDEVVSLLVDEIGDVLQVEASRFERKLRNIDPAVRDLIVGVYKLDDRLLLVLDTNKTVAVAAD